MVQANGMRGTEPSVGRAETASVPISSDVKVNPAGHSAVGDQPPSAFAVSPSGQRRCAPGRFAKQQHAKGPLQVAEVVLQTREPLQPCFLPAQVPMVVPTLSRHRARSWGQTCECRACDLAERETSNKGQTILSCELYWCYRTAQKGNHLSHPRWGREDHGRSPTKVE